MLLDNSAKHQVLAFDMAQPPLLPFSVKVSPSRLLSTPSSVREDSEQNAKHPVILWDDSEMKPWNVCVGTSAETWARRITWQ